MQFESINAQSLSGVQHEIENYEKLLQEKQEFIDLQQENIYQLEE